MEQDPPGKEHEGCCKKKVDDKGGSDPDEKKNEPSGHGHS